MAHRDIETAELSAGTSRFDDEEPAGGDNRFATQFLRLKAAAPVILALEECDAELRTEAIELFKQLEREELEEEQRFATLALLSEMLFSDLDEKELPGVDVAEAEAATASRIPLLGLMDEADDDICHDFWRPGFEIGPIGLIGHIFFGAEFSNKEGFAGIFCPKHRSADS